MVIGHFKFVSYQMILKFVSYQKWCWTNQKKMFYEYPTLISSLNFNFPQPISTVPNLRRYPPWLSFSYLAHKYFDFFPVWENGVCYKMATFHETERTLWLKAIELAPYDNIKAQVDSLRERLNKIRPNLDIATYRLQKGIVTGKVISVLFILND